MSAAHLQPMRERGIQQEGKGEAKLTHLFLGEPLQHTHLTLVVNVIGNSNMRAGRSPRHPS
jgi:hypothetical protein